MRFLTSEKIKYVALYVSALSVHFAVILVLLAIAMGVDLDA